jgi:HEAT repeat protein
VVEAVDLLAESVRSSDSKLSEAAVAALKKIGRMRAINALLKSRTSAAQSLQSLISDALIQCADGLLARGRAEPAARVYRVCYGPNEPLPIRAASLRGLLAAAGKEESLSLSLDALKQGPDQFRAIAARHLSQLEAAGVTQRLCAALPELPVEAQVFLVRALGERGDTAALAAIVKAVESPAEAVQVAALDALGSLGGAGEVALLVDLIDGGKSAKGMAAQAALKKLRAPGVAPRILECAEKQSTSTQVNLFSILAERQSIESVPALLQLTQDPSVEVRQGAYASLGELVRDDHVAALVERLAAADIQTGLPAATEAMGHVFPRLESPDQCAAMMQTFYESASIPVRCALLQLWGQLASSRTLPTVRAALKAGEQEIKDAAVRALADWPDAAPAPDLLQVVEHPSVPAHRVLALRGYLRLAELEGTSSHATALVMYQKARLLIERVEEKRLFLGGLANLPELEALSMALPYLKDTEASPEAAEATLKIATALAAKFPRQSRNALEQVKQATRDESLLKRVGEVLRKLPRNVP